MRRILSAIDSMDGLSIDDLPESRSEENRKASRMVRSEIESVSSVDKLDSKKSVQESMYFERLSLAT